LPGEFHVKEGREGRESKYFLKEMEKMMN